MTWIVYLLLFWIVCIIITLWIRFRPKDSWETTFGQILLFIIAAPFILLMLTFLKVGTYIENLFVEKKRKKMEQEELEELSLTIAKKREQDQKRMVDRNDDTLF